MRFSKFWNTFPKVSTLTDWISWRTASLSCSIVLGVYFCTLCPSIGPKERSRQALDRLPLVSNFLTNFWTEHFDSARLSPNSVRNAVWHALNEPVCQYLRTRNPHCSTVTIDNSLGSLARDSPCITLCNHNAIWSFNWLDSERLDKPRVTSDEQWPLKPRVLLVWFIRQPLNSCKRGQKRD